MSLPNLPELPNLDELEKEFSQPEIKKQAEPTRKAKSTKRAGPTKKAGLTKQAEETKLASNESNGPENGKKKKPKIPKSKYDDEGNPILMIPNLDYIALNSEIDRFFGNYEEDD